MRDFASDFQKRENALKMSLEVLEKSHEAALKNYSAMEGNYNQMAKNYEAMEKKFSQLLDENRALRQSLESLNSTLTRSEDDTSTRSTGNEKKPDREIEYDSPKP